jgi:hypothetical protein
VAALACSALCSAGAHEPGEGGLPEQAGWRAGADLALLLPRADARWPAAQWPGVLVNGSAPRDARGGLRLEHGTLDLGLRLSDRFGAYLAGGWHDRERGHAEAAWVQAEQAGPAGHWLLRLGRDTVRLGQVIDGAGHFDRFSQAPMAKRATVNDYWLDNGLTLTWQPEDEHGNGLSSARLGLWQGRGFPGGPAGAAMPSLHLAGRWQAWNWDASAAQLRPQARGAAAQTLGAVGHVHGSLDCRDSLLQRVCFDGRSTVAGASLQWAPEQGPWAVQAATLLRHEQGSLYSTSGTADVRTKLQGGWVDAAWRARDDLGLTVRAERLIANNQLVGVGTLLLAESAGLMQAAPLSRLTAAVAWTPPLRWTGMDRLTLSLEAGQERQGQARLNHAALRLVVRAPRLLGAAW